MSVCSVSHHPSTAGSLFIRQALAYFCGWRSQKSIDYFRIISKVPNKMSEAERYIIAKTLIPVKGRWYADQ